MKILYVISSFRHGEGGHLHSLRDLIENLGHAGITAIVVVIETGKRTAVFDGVECAQFHLPFEEIKEFESVIHGLKSIVERERPDVIHSFDNPSLFFSMYLSRVFRRPFIHTKPGGPNRGFFPKIPYLIVYSEENREYFAGNPKFKNTEIFFLPQRMSKVVPDLPRIKKLKEKLGLKSNATFLRITRIADVYRESILKSIDLIKKLNAAGFKSNLITIGVEESGPLYDEIKNREDESVRIVTESEYTERADSLIDIADYVIGVGNSLMAAASLSRILLTTPSDARYPLIVDEENFSRLFWNNFRCTAPPRTDFKPNEERSYETLKGLLTNENKRKAYRVFSSDLFRKYFDVNLAKERYVSIYKELRYSGDIGISDYYYRLKYTLMAYNDNSENKVRKIKFNLLNLKIAVLTLIDALF